LSLRVQDCALIHTAAGPPFLSQPGVEMPRPVTDEERSEIIEAVRGGMTRNAVARQFERSPATISKIAAAAGLDFDRSRTAAATKAKQADNRARRATITTQMLDDIEKLQTQMFAPTTVYNFGGRDNTFETADIPEPSFRDKRDITAAISNLMGRVLDTERIDQPQAGHGALEQLVEAIGRARAASG
jgi:hypothetical protein